MDKNIKPQAMPLRLIMSGVVASFLIISTVLGGVFLGTQTQQRFHDVDQSWQVYSNEAEKRGELLNRIWAHLGYGGIIHNFKNYVLRQDQEYLIALEEQFADFTKTIAEYRQSNPSPLELKNLAIIETTILAYMRKLPIAERAAVENWLPTRTDKLVKVDDRSALEALAELDKSWREKRYETTAIIAQAVDEGDKLVIVGFRFMAALLIVSLALFALFYLLQMELRKTIGKLSKELSERKIAQQIARKFQRAVEQSPVTIIITDTDKKIEYVNKRFSNLTGYELEEVIGKTPSFLQSGETARAEYLDLNEQIKRGEVWRGVFHNKKKNGDLYWAKTSILPLREDDGEITHYIGLGEDITETREAQEQMLRVQKMEAVGLLASGVAHDFNNVLTIILGNVFLARQGVSENSELAHELEQIEIAAKRARNMVGQILTFARRQPGEAVSMRVGEAIKEVSRLMRASISPNIEIICDIKNTDLSVLADPTRLHQVIMNLCSNAAEAIGANEGKIIISAFLSPKKINGKSQISILVQDNGPGIAKHLQQKIFDPFFTTKQLGKGTGLGLSVVASLVHQMNGQVAIEKSDSSGSIFKILLPEAKLQQSKVRADDLLTTGSGRILLIDDQQEVVDICKKILLKMNYKVDDYSDPKRAIEAFKKSPSNYNLVMTDFVMPNISGAQICQSVRELSNCPIIIYTAYQPDEIELEKFSPIKVLEKPADPQAISRVLQSLLGTTS